MRFPLAIRKNEVVRAHQAFSERRQPQILANRAIDNSPSQMTNGGWEAFGNANQLLVGEVQNVPLVSEAVQFADWIIGDSDVAHCHQPFCGASQYCFRSPKTANWTPLCQLIAHSIKYSAEHELMLGDEVGLDVSQNWILVFTDGHAGDASSYLSEVQQAISLAQELRIDLFLFATGSSPNMQLLGELAQVGRPPVPVAKVETFMGLFEDLFRSMYQASQGQLGRTITLGGVQLKLSR